jgi:hypothetical protein
MGDDYLDVALPLMKRQFKGVFFTKKGEAFNKNGLKLKPGITGRKAFVTIDTKRYILKDIIADLFVPNPNYFSYVDLINDSNPFDVQSKNLEWVKVPRKLKIPSNSGLFHINSTMTELKVLQVRKLLKTNMTQQQIADKVGCDRTRVSRIKNGQSYQNVR